MQPNPNRYYVTFLRHGESTGNVEKRYQGQMDFPLSKVGEAQAHALAARWKNEGFTFDLIISSPLTRALRTAEIIAGELGSLIVKDPLWMERHNGRLAGLTQEEIRALMLQPPAFVNIYEPHAETGEAEWDLYLRAGRALQTLMLRPPAHYLVVSHGALLNQVMYVIMGIAPQSNYQGARFHFDNTGFAVTSYNPATHTWRIYGLNDHAHTKNINPNQVTDV
jgi:2,3-bisphosphoglycerate-dependent phosphoglycerate mutase